MKIRRKMLLRVKKGRMRTIWVLMRMVIWVKRRSKRRNSMMNKWKKRLIKKKNQKRFNLKLMTLADRKNNEFEKTSFKSSTDSQMETWTQCSLN